MNAGVTVSAFCLAAGGVLLLFAPRETGAALFVYLTFFSSGLRKPA